MATKTDKQPEFSKSQICKSKKYEKYADIVAALLDEDKKYTFEQVDKIIDKFLKGKVN